jgi:hypothetical protein
MDPQSLAILEQAIEPYRQAGYVVASQSEGVIVLTHPPGSFNYLFFFLSLIFFWPLAVYYVVSFNNRTNRNVYIRITSDSYIEESGYTLDVVASERRRERWVVLIAIGIFLLLTLSALLILLTPQRRI